MKRDLDSFLVETDLLKRALTEKFGANKETLIDVVDEVKFRLPESVVDDLRQAALARERADRGETLNDEELRDAFRCVGDASLFLLADGRGARWGDRILWLILVGAALFASWYFLRA